MQCLRGLGAFSRVCVVQARVCSAPCGLSCLTADAYAALAYRCECIYTRGWQFSKDTETNAMFQS